MLTQTPNKTQVGQNSAMYVGQYLITVQQLKNSYTTTNPGNRMNHIVAYYNEQIFIIGGTSASNSNHDEHFRIVYWYSLENRQWNKKQFNNLIKNEEKDKDKEKQREKDKRESQQRQQQKVYSNNINTRSSMASCQKQCKLYIFGGTNSRNQCNNEMLIFDMNRYQWETPKNQYPPAARQSAYLIPFLDNYLLLYGGINLQQMEIYQHFYFYNIETGIWKIIEEGNYNNILKPRYQTSLCHIDNKLYLFGGEYRSVDGNHQFLSDFYQLTVTKVSNIGQNKNNNRSEIKIDCEYINNYNTNNIVNQKNDKSIKSQMVDEKQQEKNKQKENSKEKIKQKQKDKQSIMDIQNENQKDKNINEQKQKVKQQTQKGVASNTRKRNQKNKNMLQFVQQNQQNNSLIRSEPNIPINNTNNLQSNSDKNRKESANLSNSKSNNANQNQNVHPIPNTVNNIGVAIPVQRKYPEPKSGHKILPINKEYLILIGGGNSQQFSISNGWIYCIKNKIWKKIQFDIHIPKMMGIDCCIAFPIKQEDQEMEREKQRERERQLQKQKMKQLQIQEEKRKQKEKQRQKQKQQTNKRQTRRDKQKQREKQKVTRQQKPIKLYRYRERDLDSTDHHSMYNIIYIYGGLNCYDSVKCDLYRLKFDPQCRQQQYQQSSQMEAQNKNLRTLQSLFYMQPKSSCNYCEYPRQAIFLRKQVVQNFTTMINFPFNAFGLLLQNAYHHAATQFSVLYRSEVYQTASSTLINLTTSNTLFSSKADPNIIQNPRFPTKNLPISNTIPFLHIIQNSNIKDIEYSDLKSTIGNFQYMLHFTYHNIEKKVKLALQKQHQLRQYGMYLKIAALRLGSQFIYINKGNNGQMRIFAFLLAEIPKNTSTQQQNIQYYQFCTYLYDVHGRRVIQQPQIQQYRKHHQSHNQNKPILFSTKVNYFSSYSYQRITYKYNKYLQDIFIRYTIQSEYNHLLIFNLKQINRKINQICYQLIPTTQQIDIHYAPYRRFMTTHCLMINQSIDASLSTYLSSYFLKGESPQLSIFINNKENIINSLMCLEAFDTMTQNKEVYEIDNSLVNIQIKLMELYYNPNLKITSSNFHNGILFYHKGRLVARHQCPLGELYTIINQRKCNYFHLFGVLEVPEAIRPNIFRTDFIFNVMMEKLRSRLKFMEKKLLLQFENSHEKQGFHARSIEKPMKITKKMSQIKEKQKKQKQERQRQKKQDTQFNPNKRY